MIGRKRPFAIECPCFRQRIAAFFDTTSAPVMTIVAAAAD
jgi:hypothetical protein